MVNRYPVNIEWSEEDQEYMATCTAFPGLSAFGASEEEALREAKIALRGFIETYEANNMPLPEASRSSFSLAAGTLTGDLKPRVLMILVLALSACMLCMLWMAKIDNDWGRLIWPAGYIDFGRKALLVFAIFLACVAIGLLGLACFQCYKLITHRC